MKVFLRDIKIMEHVIKEMLKPVLLMELLMMGTWMCRNNIPKEYILVHGNSLPILAGSIFLAFILGFLALYLGEYRPYIAKQFKEKEMNKKYAFFNNRFNK